MRTRRERKDAQERAQAEFQRQLQETDLTVRRMTAAERAANPPKNLDPHKERWKEQRYPR